MIKLNLEIFPCLRTDRLLLRKISIKDEKEIFHLLSNKDVADFFQRPYARNIADARAFIKKIGAGIEANKWVFWGVSLGVEQQLIGTICLWNIDEENSKAEISYELLPNYQKRGYMKEALAAVVTFGFQKIRLKVVEARTKIDNIQSIKLLEKSNFVVDHPTLKEVNPLEWNNPEAIVYKLTNYKIKNEQAKPL